MTVDTITRETLIAAPVERVWSVLTERDHLATWFGERGAEIDLRPGGALLLFWEDMPASRGRIEVVEPPRRFVFRWTAHHAAGQEPDAGNSTRVEFTLAPEGDGTRLRVVESGFAGLATSDEQRRGNHAANVRGWAAKVEQLAAHARRVAA
jgi:uncharacterized protein YndB with AHSA1/START domain